MSDLAALPTLEQVLNSIQDGKNAHEARLPRYDRCYEVYTAAPPKGVKKEPWESKLRIRYGQQVIDTALVNIIGGPPRFSVKPRRPQDTETALHMQQVLDYHISEDHMADDWQLFVWQGLVYPLTAAKVHWLYKESERTGKTYLPNPTDPHRPVPIERPERVVLRDGPTFETWDIYDVWWEPMARDVDSAAYIVLRSWPSTEELLAQAKTERNPFGLYELDKVMEMVKDGPGNTAPRSSAAERARGGASDTKRKNRHELLEVWRDDSLTAIGNQKVVLRAETNPYWHGKKPVVIAQTRLDGFEMTGFSSTELLADLQDAINSVHNMRMDNLHLTVQRGFTYRESGILDPRSLVVKPRYMWGVTDHDDIQERNTQPLPPEAYREDEVLMGKMEHITGISSFVSGSQSVGVDQNTATGVATISEAANRLLRSMARMLTQKGLTRAGELWSDLVQQFMDKPTAIRIEGPDGVAWQEVSPQEIVGNYDIGVDGTEEAMSRQQNRQDKLGLLNALAPFANMPGLNIKPALIEAAKAFDFPNPDSLFKPPEQQQLPPAAPTGNGNGGSPQQPQLPPGLLGGQSLPPEALNRIMGGQG